MTLHLKDFKCQLGELHRNFHALLIPATSLQDLQISPAILAPVVAGTCIFSSERSSTPLDITQGSRIKTTETIQVFADFGKAAFNTLVMTDRKEGVCFSPERADLLKKQERDILCS